MSQGLRAKDAPVSWTDHTGKQWKTLTIIGRIKYRYAAAHALRAFVLWRDRNKCQICGTRDNLLLDHIVSRRNGGAHHPDNLQALCISCNARKVSTVDISMQRSITREVNAI